MLGLVLIGVAFLVVLGWVVVLNRKVNSLQVQINKLKHSQDAVMNWAEKVVEADLISVSDTVNALLSYYNLAVYEFVGGDGVKYTFLEQDDGSYKDEED